MTQPLICVYAYEATLIPVAQIREKLFQGGKLRRTWPSRWDPKIDRASQQAYYVWRWARFHGGADLRLPTLANQVCAEDPDLEALDDLANAIALEVFGTNTAGASKWREVLLTRKPVQVTPLKKVAANTNWRKHYVC